MAKIDRHPSAVTSSPPITGPAMPASPTTLMLKPMILPRSLGGKADSDMAIEFDWIIAPPAPCTTRDRTNIARLMEVPARTAPRVKMVTPIM